MPTQVLLVKTPSSTLREDTPSSCIQPINLRGTLAEKNLRPVFFRKAVPLLLNLWGISAKEQPVSFFNFEKQVHTKNLWEIWKGYSK